MSPLAEPPMILARLEEAGRYAALHPAIPPHWRSFAVNNWTICPRGRIEMTDQALSAVASRSPGRRRSDALLEAHRRHTDIHCVCAGVEEIGCKPRRRCGRPQGEYNAEADIEFFLDEPDNDIAVHPGEFVIFFPEDAHGR